MTTIVKTYSDSGAEVDRRARRFVEEHKVDYDDAMHEVLKGDPELKDAYAQAAVRVTPRRPRPRPQAPAAVKMVQGNAAGEAVHSRVEALIEEHPQLDYREAVHQVLNADPALKGQYAMRGCRHEQGI